MNFLISILLILFTTGCNANLAQINQSLEKMNQVFSGNMASSNINQSQEIDIMLMSNSADQNLKVALNEAKNNIQGFLTTNACIKGYDGSLLNKYAAPGVVFASHNYIKAPIPTTKYHDKNTCMKIRDISSIKMPVKNALSFDVVYISETSGESKKFDHALVKQVNSQWLFTK